MHAHLVWPKDGANHNISQQGWKTDCVCLHNPHLIIGKSNGLYWLTQVIVLREAHGVVGADGIEVVAIIDPVRECSHRATGSLVIIVPILEPVKTLGRGGRESAG